MSVNINYKDIALGAKEGFIPSASEQSETSNIMLLTQDEVEYSEGSNPCEFYNFFLDGKEKALSENYENENHGLVSAQVSGEDGLFETPVVLTLTAQGYFSAPGITFYFDRLNGIWANSINVKWNLFIFDSII